MNRQVLYPVLPAIKSGRTEPATTVHCVLSMVQQAEIRLPTRPAATLVKLAQMLPQMVLTGKSTFGYRTRCARIKLVRSNVLLSW